MIAGVAFSDKDIPRSFNSSRLLLFLGATGWIYDADTLAVLHTFTYTTTTGEGWGVTYDESNAEFVVSDGSSTLHFMPPYPSPAPSTAPTGVKPWLSR